MACDKPLVGLSSLDALAHQADARCPLVAAWQDARKQEVYAAFYRCHEGAPVRQAREQVARPEHLLGAIDGECLFIGPGAVLYRDLIVAHLGTRAVFAEPQQHTIRGASLGVMAFARLQVGEADDPATLVPRYVRASDAQLQFGKSSSESNN
jgi:tRNA threonylcarbamoyladenosine biosynthesis protein TsaB